MKGRSKKAEGGAKKGDDDAEMDIKEKPANRIAANKVEEEASELKKGGRAKRARGGKTSVGEVKGEKAKMHAGRMPRKSGGRTGADSNPFSSARKGTKPAGHMTMDADD